MKYLYFLIPLLISIEVFGQSVKGKITDAQTGKALENVNIFIASSSRGTVSNKEGFFLLEKLNKGSYILIFSSVGYSIYREKVEIKEEDIELEIKTEPAVIHLNKAIVVTARRFEDEQFELPEAITVLTPKEIQQSSPRSTPEALMGMSGVWVQKTNHGGGSPFIRGLTGNQTLLMIDGIRLNNSTYRFGPNQYLSTVDPLTVQQIEVLRGSGSVQYGSDALGGVAQIFTKTPNFSENFKVSPNLYVKYMSADMENTARTEMQFSNKKWSVLGGLTLNDFGDIVGGEGIGKQNPTGYRQISGDAKGRLLLSKNKILTFAYQYLYQKDVPLFHKVQLENFAYNQFNPQRRQLAYLRLESFYENRWFQKLSFTASTSESLEGKQFEKNAASNRTEEVDKINTLGGIVEIHSSPSEKWQFDSGIEFYRDKVKSSKAVFSIPDNNPTFQRGLYPDNSKAGSLAMFSLHRLNLNKLIISGGLRFNAFQIRVKDETLGETTLKPEALVSNFAIQYFLHPQHQVIASVNSAFRSPNIDDLGTLGVVDFRYEVPTFDLKPEKSLNFEIGYKINSKKFSASLAAYRNELTDLIVRAKSSYNGLDSIDGKQVYRKENVTAAYIQGVEADMEILIHPQWALYSSINYTFGENITAKEPLRRIPPLNGRLGLRYQSNFGLWSNIEWWYADKQSRLAQGDKDDNRINPAGTPAWNVLNYYLGYKYRFFQLNFGIQNLFDVAYRTHGSGVDGYGRSFWLATRLSF